jgi:cytochrome c556
MRQKRLAMIACALVAGAMMATSVLAQDGKAAFEKRRGTMKEISRAFYTGIGRVVKGRADYGPDTVVSAETLAKLTATIATLFPPGSEAPESRMKPAILSAPEKVTQLTAALQATMPSLIDAVKSGDKARIAAAYETTNNACEACHTDYRAKEL